MVFIYKEFEKYLFVFLEEYMIFIFGVIEVIEKLKRDGIKIGFIIGYIIVMMNIVLFGVVVYGYIIDNCVIFNNFLVGCL